MSNKTIRIQVVLPATQVSLFDARKSADLIINGIETLDRFGGEYDVKAIHAFTQSLRGAAGTYEFDVKLDLMDEEEAEIMQEIVSSLPATHRIIEAPAVTIEGIKPVVTLEAAEAFLNKVKEVEPGISGSVDDKLIIKGSYRGKSSNAFSYSFIDRKFIYNKGGEIISCAFEKAKNNS
jgi:hypothetical protein